MQRLLVPGRVVDGRVGFFLTTDFWQAKACRNGSARECNRQLSHSPWAHACVLTGLLIPAFWIRSAASLKSGRSVAAGASRRVTTRFTWTCRSGSVLHRRTQRAVIGRMQLQQNPEHPGVQGEAETSVSEAGPPEIAVELTWFSWPGVLPPFPRWDDPGGRFFDGSEETLLFRLEGRFGAIEQTSNSKKMLWRGGFTL